jgi:formylglycine-generating enzyme required for sulfatase activity
MNMLIRVSMVLTVLLWRAALGMDLEVPGMKFVHIPSGTMQMGDPSADEWDDAVPVHQVTLDAFEIMTTEVTQSMWEAVLGITIREQRDMADPTRMLYGEGWSYPVHYINRADCIRFAERMNQLDPSHLYRLPSEAEWEYACRAGSETQLTTGDEASGFWFRDNSDDRLHPVAELMPNGWGLYDMLGNALELCEDTYHPNYEGAPSDGSPWIQGNGSSSFQVSRGGSFDLGAGVCTPFARFYEIEQERQHYLGFRLVRTPR